MSKFSLYTDKHNDFRWRFHASNDQVVARSNEAYRSKDDCVKSLELLRKDIGGATVDLDVQTVQSKGMPQRAASPAIVPAAVGGPVEVKPVVAAS